MERQSARRGPKHTPVLVQTALERLGARIVTARKSREMTQEQLAHFSDVSLSTLRTLESGGDGVSTGNLLKVLQGLGLMEQIETLLEPARDAEVVAFATRLTGER